MRALFLQSKHNIYLEFCKKVLMSMSNIFKQRAYAFLSFQLRKLTIVFFFFQVDSDLVFDNIEERNGERHFRDLSHNALESASSQQIDQEHWLSGTLHRIRRHIGKFFNSFQGENDTSKRKTKRESAGVDLDGQEDYDAQNVCMPFSYGFCL